MRRFFLYLSVGVTLGVVSILARSFVARESVLTSLNVTTKPAPQGSTLLLAQESANEAFGKTLQEEWPIDVTLACMLALGLGKVIERAARNKSDKSDTAARG